MLTITCSPALSCFADEHCPSYNEATPSDDSGNLFMTTSAQIKLVRKIKNTDVRAVHMSHLRLDVGVFQVPLRGSIAGNQGERNSMEPKRYRSSVSASLSELVDSMFSVPADTVVSAISLSRLTCVNMRFF